MYISTNHSIGETVYCYFQSTDSVVRAKVTKMIYVKSKYIDELRYTIAIRGTGEQIECDSESLFSRPESAFYNNMPTDVSPEVEAAEA